MSRELLLALAASSILAWAIAGASYYTLRKWVRECRGLRIAVARKRRVLLDAPITDWLGWGRRLRSKGQTGQIVYRDGHVSVSVLAPRTPALEVVKRGLLRRLAGRLPKRAPRVRDAGGVEHKVSQGPA